MKNLKYSIAFCILPLATTVPTYGNDVPDFAKLEDLAAQIGNGQPENQNPIEALRSKQNNPDTPHADNSSAVTQVMADTAAKQNSATQTDETPGQALDKRAAEANDNAPANAILTAANKKKEERTLKSILSKWGLDIVELICDNSKTVVATILMGIITHQIHKYSNSGDNTTSTAK